LTLPLCPEPTIFHHHCDSEPGFELVKSRILLIDGGINLGQNALRL
jgi:hypothetical protein